jgi:aspartate/methionine/tyrosine aminotransferase
VKFHTIAYMEWAKRTHSLAPARYDLSTSAMEHVPDGALGSLDGLRMHGDNAYGHPGLRALLADRYRVPGDRVLCSVAGTSMANFLMAAALVSDGDRVMVEWPCYEPLWRVFEAIGGRVDFIERRRTDRYALHLDRVTTGFARGARVLALSNLMNPTGVLLDPATIRAAGEIAARYGGHVLVDEVYLDGAFTRSGARSAAMDGGAPGIIVTSSLTKSYGLGGLRAGWAIAPAAVVERAYRVADHLVVEHPYIADELALRALERLHDLRARAEKRQRESLPIVRAWATRRGDVDLLEPDGGFVAWVRLPAGWSSASLEAPLRARDVAVSPGHYFGITDHIRIGFGGPPDLLEEGLDLLSRVLNERREP